MNKSLVLLSALMLLTGCAHRRAGYTSEGDYGNEYDSAAEPSYADGYGGDGIYPYDYVGDCYYNYSIPRSSRLAFPCNYGPWQSNGLRSYSYSPGRPSIQRQAVQV